MCRSLAAVVLLLGVSSLGACPKDDEIEVKVLAILASEHHTEVNQRLTEFAKQVRKKEPKLTGFKLDRSTSVPFKLGETKKFEMPGGDVVEVTVNKERDENGRITLTITPPKLKPIVYECACDKYFSIATQQFVGKDKDREQLFVAVMAKPCKLPKGDKPPRAEKK
jgi:hypothetical protein